MTFASNAASDRLPQLSGRPFLTDGGIETQLIYLEGLELPLFAAFHLLRDAKAAAVVERVLGDYARVARDHGVGCILESVTWRASRDWGSKLGYNREDLAHANYQAIDMLRRIRGDVATAETPVVISGNVGPRGDGYVLGEQMSPAEAEAYHGEQVAWLDAADVDLITAVTLNYVDEAIGFANAVRRTRRPCVVSFTVETDGRLPGGETIGEAIMAVDEASAGYPAYYMINCAHPSHFAAELENGGTWRERIRGIRANASCKSHAELDASETLDAGDRGELAGWFRRLRDALPHLNVLGGCCGTDPSHIAAIASACYERDLAGADARRAALV